jgi:NAD(P)-dependent dehydrogenase (short-subunit alcohol dehydrogenase family)
MSEFATRETHVSTVFPLRMMRNIWRQAAMNPRCPETPRLEGKLAVVTGGNAGIGREIARGLAKRGAEVIVAARTEKTAKEACDAIAKETGSTLSWVPLDLADLASVAKAIPLLKERTIDVLVANAGLMPERYATSAQGHELAFAVNTLAHFMFVTRLREQTRRAVILTGDIYARAKDCTPDFRYDGGGMAYCRSKLGNLWFTLEMRKRHPDFEIVTVHPGVVRSGFGGRAPGTGPFFMIDSEAGAQAPLWCATRPVENGAYYHNTMGKMLLAPTDAARNATRARELWETMEKLCAPFSSG